MKTSPDFSSIKFKFAYPIVLIASTIIIFEFGFKVGQKLFGMLH